MLPYRLDLFVEPFKYWWRHVTKIFKIKWGNIFEYTYTLLSFSVFFVRCLCVINHFCRNDTGENDVKFTTAFNEENRHTPLEQDELLAFSTHVAKFSGTRSTSLMIFIDNNTSKCTRTIKKCGKECKNKCSISKIKIT